MSDANPNAGNQYDNPNQEVVREPDTPPEPETPETEPDEPETETPEVEPTDPEEPPA
jgi:hypothetical protein